MRGTVAGVVDEHAAKYLVGITVKGKDVKETVDAGQRASPGHRITHDDRVVGTGLNLGGHRRTKHLDCATVRGLSEVERQDADVVVLDGCDVVGERGGIETMNTSVVYRVILSVRGARVVDVERRIGPLAVYGDRTLDRVECLGRASDGYGVQAVSVDGDRGGL